MGLIKWGIERIDNFERDIRLWKSRFGSLPLSWRQVVMANPAKDGLLWRVPDPDVPMASSFNSIQAILVAENEQVMVLRNGVLGRGMEGNVTLLPGLYDFTRTEMREQLEIIWTTTREFQLRWGVPEVLTRDRISIGASGYYLAAIEDPQRFLMQVVGNAQVYKEDQLAVFARSTVTDLLRDLIARKTVIEFQTARQELLAACREQLQPIFERWGLEFRGLTIENQYIPEAFLQAAAGQTIVSMEKEAQLAGAKFDAALIELAAQAEANKTLAIGRVDVELMLEQQRIGIDPLELKRIEAAKTLAANPGQASLIDTRPQIVNQLLAQPSAPQGGHVTIVPVDNSQSLPPLLLDSHRSGPLSENGVPVPAEPTSTGSAPTREAVEEALDTLDMRFLKGEMSEPTFLMLRERWQKKLEHLEKN